MTTENTLPTVQRVQQSLAGMKKQFSSTLPSHVSPAKFMRSAVTAVQNTPDLQECEVNSIISSCQKAAVDGLIFDGREAAMVTFNKKVGSKWVKEAQYMPMVAGILKKARNSGQISAISAHVVYDNDQFDYELGLEPKLTHRPIIDGEPGELRCAYAIAKLKDGSTQFEVMTRPQIEEIMKSSKAGWDDKEQKTRGIWKKWESEMWRKTVLKRLAKYLPSSSDLEGIIDYDNKEFGVYEDHKEPEATPSPKEEVAATHDKKPTKAAAAVMAQAEDISEGEIIDDAPPMTDDDLI